MRVVFCTTVLPASRSTGGEIASMAFVDALAAAGHDVTVLGYVRPGDDAAHPAGWVPVEARPIESERTVLLSRAWLGTAFATGRAYSVQKYVGGAYVAALRTALAIAGPDALVVLDHAQMGFLLPHLPRHVRRVFVAHNVERQLYAAQAVRAGGLRRRLLQREAERIGRLEIALATDAAETWTLTATDADYFTQAGARHVSRFDVPSPGAILRPAVATEWDVGLIGTWSWSANAAGLRWFLDAVRPRLGPDVRVAVAGRGADDASDGVNRLGFVEDAHAFMRACRVLCVPSVAGAGVQIKTLDAIASGRPVVVTRIGLRGITNPPATVRVAESAPDFVAAVRHSLGEAPAGPDGRALDWSLQRVAAFRAEVAHRTGVFTADTAHARADRTDAASVRKRR